MELMMRQGEIAARGAERSGMIWGRAIENLGQIAGHAVEQHQQDKIAKQKDEGIYSVMQSWDGQDPTALVKGLATYIGPIEAVKVAGGLQKLMEAKQVPQLDASHIAGPVGALAALERSSPGHLQRNWGLIFPQIESLAKQAGLPVSPEWSEDMTRGVMTLDQQFNPPKPTGDVVETVDVQGNPIRRRVSEAELSSPGGVPAWKKPDEGPKLGSFERHILDKFGPKATPQQVEGERKNWAEAGRVSVTVGAPGLDPQAIADGIERGDMPPTVNQYGRAVVGAVSSILAKKGYNLAAAQTDWNATQKHVATLNGSQQTRLRQAVNTAFHSLDVIEDLAKQWQGGKFPMLNKGQLVAAKAGAMGPKAQAIATQLEAQISDVTSELGNVYMGGNSPTDHALQLAAKNLSADWSLTQLQAALELSRKNLQIRSNSMVNVGVAGGSADNPYDDRLNGGAPEAVLPPEDQKAIDALFGKKEKK
jgi:hypothetical protein